NGKEHRAGLRETGSPMIGGFRAAMQQGFRHRLPQARHPGSKGAAQKQRRGGSRAFLKPVPSGVPQPPARTTAASGPPKSQASIMMPAKPLRDSAVTPQQDF